MTSEDSNGHRDPCRAVTDLGNRLKSKGYVLRYSLAGLGLSSWGIGLLRFGSGKLWFGRRDYKLEVGIFRPFNSSGIHMCSNQGPLRLRILSVYCIAESVRRHDESWHKSLYNTPVRALPK